MEKTNRQKIDAGEKLFHVVFFALAFVLMGKFIPEIYFKYFDKTEYYTVEIPILLDKKEYKACETLIMEIKRNSLVNTDATSYLELILVRESGANQEFDRITKQIVLDKGQKEIGVPLPIPCNSIPGTYFYQGVVGFTINGIDHHTPLKTDTFKVIN